LGECRPGSWYTSARRALEQSSCGLGVRLDTDTAHVHLPEIVLCDDISSLGGAGEQLSGLYWIRIEPDAVHQHVTNGALRCSAACRRS